MPDERSAAQLLRIREAMGVHDDDTVAVRLGVPFTQFVRWREGSPVPGQVLAKAAQLTGVSVDWLACGRGDAQGA